MTEAALLRHATVERGVECEHESRGNEMKQPATRAARRPILYFTSAARAGGTPLLTRARITIGFGYSLLVTAVIAEIIHTDGSLDFPETAALAVGAGALMLLTQKR